METTTEDFVNSFHQISGTTVGERRKKLFTLLNRTNDVNVAFESIVPKSALEESFKIETLLRFNNIKNLIEVLKSENPKLINKLINSKFLERIFEYVDETRLVEDYFPYFSFNTKLKLINKLSFCVKDEKKIDAFFWAIEKKYGFYLATKLLPCCSESLILQCVESLKFELTPKQLLFIVKKHPHLTLDILKALKRYTDATVIGYKYKLVFVHVLKTDLGLFLKMQKEYPCNLRVGWRSTQKIVTANKDRVIDNAVVFYRFLHAKQMVKSFSTDFPKFYAKMFPSSLSLFKADISYYVKLIEHVPVGISKIDLLLRTFQDTYNYDMWKSGCIHQSVMELMSNDERQSWIDSHPKPDNLSEEVWICLMKTEKSIPTLKKLISSKSDIKDRSELVGCLVESCRINNDQQALMDLCKYMLSQHRNDNSSVLLSFLNTIQSCYDLNTLNEPIWKYLIDLVTHLSSREEIYYQHNDWFIAYINYLILNNLLTKDQFVSLMKKMNTSVAHLSMKQKHAQKKFLLMLGEALPDLYDGDELNNPSVQFIQTILQWNRKERHDPISLLPYESAFDFFRKQIEDFNQYQYLATDVVLQLMRSNMSEENKQKYLGCLFKKKQIYIEIDLLLWFIKVKPTIVVEHFEGITTILLRLKPTKGMIFFWLFCGNYVHLNLPQKISEICMDLLKKDDNDIDKKNIVLALACLLEPQRFLELIEFYYTNELIMDVNSEDQDLYKIQQGIMIALKTIVPPSVTFDSILRFSKGDYMKFIQRTLHSVSHNAAENRLSGFFPSFRDHPVSVRKHAIYQTFKVMDKSEIFSMINFFKRNEKNSSILKLLFKGIFNYFVKNPSDRSFELVKEQLRSVDVSDEEAFEILLNVKKVPLKYLPEYLVFSYKVFETLPEVNAKVVEGKTQLLNAISSEIIEKLSEDFSWSVACKVFEDRTGFGDVVQDFSCRFLAYSVNDRVADVFGVVKNYIGSFWCADKDKFVVRKQINSFVHKLCGIFIADRNADKQRLEVFASLWNDFMKPYQAFHEYLEMYFSLGVLKELDLFGIVLNLHDLLNEYDCVVAFDIAKVLSAYISHFLKGDDDYFELNRLEFIMTLINSGKRICMLLGASLLPYSFPSNFRIDDSYQTVLRCLHSCEDSVVRLYFSFYLHKLSLEQNTDDNENVIDRYRSTFYVMTFTNKYRQ